MNNMPKFVVSNTLKDRSLNLTDKKTFASAIAVLCYEPAGVPAQKEVQHSSA